MYQVCLNTETRGCESTGTSTWTPMYVGKFFQIHLLMLELALVCIFVSMSICSSWGSHWTRNVKWHKAVRLAGTRTRSSPWENHTRREARWWYYRVVGMVFKNMDWETGHGWPDWVKYGPKENLFQFARDLRLRWRFHRTGQPYMYC